MSYKNRLNIFHQNTLRIRELYQRKTEESINYTCRICLETTIESGDTWIHPCKCKGSVEWSHHNCLRIWLDISKRNQCDLCETRYRIIDNSSSLKYYSNEISWILTTLIVFLFFYSVKNIFQIRSIWNSQFIRLTYIGFALILTVFDFGLSFFAPEFYIDINQTLIDDSISQDNLLFVFIYIHQVILSLYSKIPFRSDITILDY